MSYLSLNTPTTYFPPISRGKRSKYSPFSLPSCPSMVIPGTSIAAVSTFPDCKMGKSGERREGYRGQTRSGLHVWLLHRRVWWVIGRGSLKQWVVSKLGVGLTRLADGLLLFTVGVFWSWNVHWPTPRKRRRIKGFQDGKARCPWVVPFFYTLPARRASPVISGFETAVNDIALLDDLPFSLIIIDEVHRVKNLSTASARAFRRFTCQRRFGLTGTMIQNNYMEMWTILDWTSPGKLGTKKQWMGYVVKPLTIGQSKSATEEERSKALVSWICFWMPIRTLLTGWTDSGRYTEG
jgi:hypothetical protein